MREPMPELKPRYEEFAEASSLFTDPAAAALRTSPLAQFWRELLLARSMIDQGLYDEGYLVTIAPALNYHVQDAAEAYQAHLREPEDGWASRPWSGCSKGPRTARRSGGRRRGAGTVGRTGPKRRTDRRTGLRRTSSNATCRPTGRGSTGREVTTPGTLAHKAVEDHINGRPQRLTGILSNLS